MKPSILTTPLTFLVLASTLWLCGFGCGGDAELSPVSSETPGKGGSTARFTIVGDNLYTLNGMGVITYDMPNAADEPSRVDSLSLVNNTRSIPETLFPFGGLMLSATTGGTFIMSRNQNTGRLTLDGIFNRWLPQRNLDFRDPVVAQDTLAYTTIRTTGTTADLLQLNELQVVNISDIRMPVGGVRIPMVNPRGLAVEGQDLFVCDRDSLVQFDLANPALPRRINNYNIRALDVLFGLQNQVIVVGGDGLSQFGLGPDRRLQFISHLPIAYEVVELN